MKNVFLALILTFVSANVLADSEIKSSNRSSCQQSDFQPFEVSAGISTGDDSYDYYDDFNNQRSYNDETRLELEFKYSFGGAEQIDCGHFQSLVEREQEAHTKQLELKVKQLEAQLAKQQRITQATQGKVTFK